MSRSLLMTCVLCLGCSAPIIPFVPCDGGRVDGGAPPVFVTGRVANVVMTMPFIGGCSASQLRADRVNASVLDPLNAAVPSTASAPIAIDVPELAGQSWATTVTFTPTIPGAYHLTAAFEPNMGIGQLDVLAAEDHLGGTPELVLPAAVASGCGHFQVMSGGAIVCLDGRVFRDGGQVQRLSGSQAVDGAVVWSVDINSASRWVDTGTGLLVRQPSTTLQLPTNRRGVLPGIDDLTVFVGTTRRWYVDGGAFSESVSVAAPSGLGAVAAARQDDLLLMVSQTQTCWSDGGTVACANQSGSGIAAWSPRGVWLTQASGASVELYLPNAMSSVGGLSALPPKLWSGGFAGLNDSLGGTPMLLNSSGGVPIASARYRPSTGVVLEVWGQEGEALFESLETHVVMRRVNGDFAFYRVPP